MIYDKAKENNAPWRYALPPAGDKLIAICVANLKIKVSDILKNTLCRELRNVCKDVAGAYICGGYLRNYVIGNEHSKDLDLFLNCSAVELGDVLQRMEQLGTVEFGQYGSPRLLLNSGEGYVDIVPFYNFNVPQKPITSIDDLLLNFDITANALGINIHTGEFFSPVNGLEDIEKHILRAVRLDFPERPVSKDIPMSAVSVFWFRLLYYQQKMGFTMDPKTREWVLANKRRWADYAEMKEYFFEPQISEEMKILLTT